MAGWINVGIRSDRTNDLYRHAQGRGKWTGMYARDLEYRMDGRNEKVGGVMMRKSMMNGH